LWQRASAHQEALRREFDIIMADLPRDSVPHRLAELIDSLDRQFGRMADPTRQEMYAAVERGDDETTLVYRVPPEAADAARQLEEMLDRVDEFCRTEALLTLATPPEVVAFRRWFLGEFVRQIEEERAPKPWRQRDSDVAADEPAGVSTAEGNGRVVRFDGDLDLATAGALRDELLDARKHHAASVVVDLSGVKFVDSVGLSLLVTARNRLEEEGVEMRLVLPEKLRLLFEISGLTELLQPEFVGQEGEPAPTGEGA
jgi:anti-anti-sigma factor